MPFGPDAVMIIGCCLIGVVEFNWGVAIEGTTEATVFALEDTIIFGEATEEAVVGAIVAFAGVVKATLDIDCGS